MIEQLKQKMKRKCDNCGKEYEADNRNLNRGWGLCCSKSCAAKKRERSKPTYNADRVAFNNIKREGMSSSCKVSRHFLSYDGADDDQWGDCDLGIHD